MTFWKRTQPGIDPRSAHLMRFALDVGQGEIVSLIALADERRCLWLPCW